MAAKPLAPQWYCVKYFSESPSRYGWQPYEKKYGTYAEAVARQYVLQDVWPNDRFMVAEF